MYFLFQKIVDVFCGDCSVMICSVCCLKYHVRHSYKLLENMGEEIQSKLNIQKMDFKYENYYMYNFFFNS